MHCTVWSNARGRTAIIHAKLQRWRLVIRMHAKGSCWPLLSGHRATLRATSWIVRRRHGCRRIAHRTARVRHACAQWRSQRFCATSGGSVMDLKSRNLGSRMVGREAARPSERIRVPGAGILHAAVVRSVASCRDRRHCFGGCARARRGEERGVSWRSCHWRSRRLIVIGSSHSFAKQRSHHWDVVMRREVGDWRGERCAQAWLSSVRSVKRLRHVEVFRKRSRLEHALTIVARQTLQLCTPGFKSARSWISTFHKGRTCSETKPGLGEDSNLESPERVSLGVQHQDEPDA